MGDQAYNCLIHFYKRFCTTEARMHAEFLNIMVYDYLTQIDPKLAKKFKKEANVTEELPSGSPGIKDIVQFFKETSPEKSNHQVEGEKSKKKEKKIKEEDAVEMDIPKKSKKSKKVEVELNDAAERPADSEGNQSKKAKKTKSDEASEVSTKKAKKSKK